MSPPTDPPTLPERIAAALERIANATRSQGQKAATAHGLSPLQSRVLAVLERRGPQRIGALASELLVANATVSEAVTTLADKRLVVKGSDPQERRAVLVELSRSGRSLARRADAWPVDALVPALDGLDPAESEMLLATLLRVIHGLEEQGVVSTTRTCVSCRFFAPWAGRSKKRPHRCRLLESDLAAAELRVDCPEFEPATTLDAEANWDRFHTRP